MKATGLERTEQWRHRLTYLKQVISRDSLWGQFRDLWFDAYKGGKVYLGDGLYLPINAVTALAADEPAEPANRDRSSELSQIDYQLCTNYRLQGINALSVALALADKPDLLKSKPERDRLWQERVFLTGSDKPIRVWVRPGRPLITDKDITQTQSRRGRTLLTAPLKPPSRPEENWVPARLVVQVDLEQISTRDIDALVTEFREAVHGATKGAEEFGSPFGVLDFLRNASAEGLTRDLFRFDLALGKGLTYPQIAVVEGALRGRRSVNLSSDPPTIDGQLIPRKIPGSPARATDEIGDSVTRIYRAVLRDKRKDDARLERITARSYWCPQHGLNCVIGIRGEERIWGDNVQELKCSYAKAWYGLYHQALPAETHGTLPSERSVAPQELAKHETLTICRTCRVPVTLMQVGSKYPGKEPSEKTFTVTRSLTCPHCGADLVEAPMVAEENAVLHTNWQMIEKLAEVFNQLFTPEERDILAFRFSEGLKEPQIASRLGKPRRWVEKTYASGFGKMTEALKLVLHPPEKTRTS